MAEKKTIFQEFSKGLLKENPVLRLVLGTCPTLATTTSLESAIGMGLSAAIVLVCSNIVISALRKVIPSKVRIPCYIVVIAGFVTIVQMLVKAYLPALNDMLGVYLPLIVVNLSLIHIYRPKFSEQRLCAGDFLGYQRYRNLCHDAVSQLAAHSSCNSDAYNYADCN